MSAPSIDVVVQAIKQITSPRFYCSERGFQGQLKSNLDSLLKQKNLLPDRAIIEEEYQKTIPKHGITHRPDIIVHIPFEEKIAGTRDTGNFIAFELKLCANKDDALCNFRKLNDYITILKYPLGIFVNIDCEETFVDLIPNEKIHVLNVLRNGHDIVVTHSYLKDGKLISRKL